MKLANALSQRAELQTRIHQLETRLYNNAQVQEGDQVISLALADREEEVSGAEQPPEPETGAPEQSEQE